MEKILCLALLVYLISCSSACTPWVAEEEIFINFDRYMQTLNKVTFTDVHSIQIMNCSTGVPVTHDYVIDYTSDFLWEFRHSLYAMSHEALDACKDCITNPSLSAFQGCMIRERTKMQRNIPTLIQAPINDHLSQIKQEELDKCNSIP